MSRNGESPKDRVYATCATMGEAQVQKNLSEDTFFTGADKGYALEWIAQQEEKKSAFGLAKDANKTSRHAFLLSVVALVVSILIAIFK